MLGFGRKESEIFRSHRLYGEYKSARTDFRKHIIIVAVITTVVVRLFSGNPDKVEAGVILLAFSVAVGIGIYYLHAVDYRAGTINLAIFKLSETLGYESQMLHNHTLHEVERLCRNKLSSLAKLFIQYESALNNIPGKDLPAGLSKDALRIAKDEKDRTSKKVCDLYELMREFGLIEEGHYTYFIEEARVRSLERVSA